MLSDTTNPKTVEESYTSASGASNLHLEAHRIGAIDLIAAAGMNQYRAGLALMRLREEWDKSAKPAPLTPMSVQLLAVTLGKEPPGDEHAGLVREVFERKERYRLPLAVARDIARDWYEHEQGILLQNLKTLPQVRAALVFWLARPDAIHIVSRVLLWWLDPKCKTCNGSGVRVVTGTGGRSNGMPCPDCRKSNNPGDAKIPHSGHGRRLVSYINECRRHAARDVGQGSAESRSASNTDDRLHAAWSEAKAKVAAVERELKADKAQDTAAIAEQFRQSMK